MAGIMEDLSQNEQRNNFNQQDQLGTLDMSQQSCSHQSFTLLTNKRKEMKQLLDMDQTLQKQQTNISSSINKGRQHKNVDLNSSQLYNGYLVHPKTSFRSFISVTPIIQTKKQISNIENKIQTISNTLTKSALGTQSANLSISKSPQILSKDQIYDNYLSKNSVYKITRDFAKRRDTSKENPPSYKNTIRQNTETLPVLKQNEQKSLLYENNYSTLPTKNITQNDNLISNLLNFELNSKFSTLEIQPNSAQTQNSLLLSKKNWKIQNNIKINNNCDYSTKELLIPISKIESFYENYSNLNSEKVKGDENLKQDKLLNNRQLRFQNVDNPDQSRNIQIKHESIDNLKKQEKQLKVLNQESSINNQEIKLSENKLKKTRQVDSSKSPLSLVARQRSITTQSYLNNNLAQNIERQESLPKIEQTNVLNQSSINKNNDFSSKIQFKYLKDENKRISIQKRLQNLMSYSVEEEFKKRFSGLFLAKQKMQKKNDVKKKVHFIIDEVQ